MTELPPTTPRARLVIDLGPEFETPAVPATPALDQAPPPVAAPQPVASAPAPQQAVAHAVPEVPPAPAWNGAAAAPHPSVPGAVPANNASALPLASRGTRFGAAIVDTIILFAIAVAAALVVGRVVAQVDLVLALVAIYATYLLVLCGVPAVLMAREGEHRGQTWGKQMVRVRVVMADGSPIRPSTAWLRCAVLPVVLALTVVGGLIDALWPLFDPQKRRLVDLPLGTIVVTAEPS